MTWAVGPLTDSQVRSTCCLTSSSSAVGLYLLSEPYQNSPIIAYAAIVPRADIGEGTRIVKRTKPREMTWLKPDIVSLGGLYRCDDGFHLQLCHGNRGLLIHAEAIEYSHEAETSSNSSMFTHGQYMASYHLPLFSDFC